MTAVENLIDQLTSVGVLEIPQGSNVVTYIIKQAKEMEKERIIKTYEVGISRGTNYDEDVYHKNNWRSGEKYYNETFKNK